MLLRFVGDGEHFLPGLGDCVLVLDRQVGRGTGSGAPVSSPIANILDFRGGRIWRSRAYFDRARALRAAGLSE
jgi:ketosteroid isomerase-like protein